MKNSDYLLIGAAAIGVYLVYRQLNKGTTPESAARLFEQKGYNSEIINTTAANNTGINSNHVLSVYTPKTGLFGENTGTRTYLFTQEELNRLNWAQKILLNIGVSPEWVLE